MYFRVGGNSEFPKFYFPRREQEQDRREEDRRMKSTHSGRIAVRVRDSWGSASLTVVITIIESYLVEVIDRLKDTLVYT